MTRDDDDDDDGDDNNNNNNSKNAMKKNLSLSTNRRQIPFMQGCISLGHQVVLATMFCTVATSNCGVSVWDLLRVTVLAPGTLRWLLILLNICAP